MNTEFSQRQSVHAKQIKGAIIGESPRQTSIRQRTQVLICGAGPAGLGAALAAAGRGAKVTLLERWAMPGGMWTAGLVNPMLEYCGRGYIVNELIRRLNQAGAWRKWWGSYSFSPEIMKLELEAMLKEAGVEVLYYTLATEPIVEDGRVCGAVIESKAGREAILADVVIDATGDGDIAARAGCRFAFGRPGDGAVQPMTMMFEIRGLNGYDRRNPFELYDQLVEVLEKSGDPEPLPIQKSGASPYIITLPGSDAAAVQATHVYRLNPLNPADLTTGVMDARKQAHRLVSLLKQMPRFADLEMTVTAGSLGIRESRRVLGHYVLGVEDLRAGSQFEDAVTAATFPVDIHQPDPDSELETHADMPMKPYEIPYRCLLPADVEGLLLAGRCISGDHFAHASYRVTGTMMAVGQAAGLAAATAVQNGVSPSAVDGAALHAQLRDRGVQFVRDGAKFMDSPKNA